MTALKDDPCEIANSLPNFELRLKVYKIDLARGDRPICDRYFIKEPGEWFRTMDGNEMVNNKTDFFECGTQYSIYMEGNVPSSLNRIVNRTACVVPNCRTKYNIQLKNCVNFTAYYLPRPSSCDQAYCFGYGENGIAPNTTTGKPTVRYQLVKSPGKTAADLSEQKLVFQCHFAPVNDTNIVYYKVFWYVNDHTSTIFASHAVPKDRLPETYLRGETGLNSIKLNIEISCKVRLYYHPKGPPGPSSKTSEKFFAGIQPVKRAYEVMRDRNTSIQFKLTVPFGCTYADHNDPDPLPCKHTLSLTTPDYLKCGQGIYAVDMCGKRIESQKWNEIQDISIKHKNDNNYRTVPTFEIHTKTKVRSDGEPFWDGVELPTIYINVMDGPKKWPNAKCTAISDPHMTSFNIDGAKRHYESQEPGTYTLYRNMDDSGNVNEIQMKVTPCLYYLGHMNHCACGIAARASSDIYVIDRCPGTVPFYFGFKSCVEDILHVMKKAQDDHDYEIQFPSGTSLEVRLNSVNNKWTLELQVNPSIADEDRSQGLCGTVGSSKHFSPNKVDFTNREKEFSESWKVADADNMFMMSLEKLQSFPKTQKSRDLCICEKPAPPLLGDIIDTATCTNSKESLISCEKEKNLKPVQKDVCYERQNRRKRSARHSFTFIPQLGIRPIWKRSKRATSANITIMTKAQAKTWCENYMNSSPTFLACQDIPNINSTRAVEICVMDILTTNSTVFATAPRESVRRSCLKEIASNDTLKNVTKNGEKIADKILSIACPGECSGHGVCNKGVCQCNDDFGGGDCSVDTNEPPPVYAVNYETGGLCDKLFCKEAIVEGDLFLDRSGLTCKMQRFEMTMNGTSSDLETSHVPGSHNTLSDIRCKFPRSHSKRSTVSSIGFITGYKVSVSNNNKNFSDAHAVYILDSTCQDTLNVSGQLRFALKPGFCFIHGSCVPDGVQKKCYECDIRQNKFEWTYRETEKGCTKEENSPLWVIGVVLAVLLLILIGLAFFYIIKKKHRVVHDSFEMPNPQRQASKYSK